MLIHNSVVNKWRRGIKHTYF